MKKLRFGIFSQLRPDLAVFLCCEGHNKRHRRLTGGASKKIIKFSKLISHLKVATVTPHHSKSTEENETCNIKTLDSARLD
jgi:hypothetical protein